MSIVDITKVEDIVKGPDRNGSVLFFWASWHEESSSSGSMYAIFQTLAESMTGVGFYRVEAESVSSLTEAYNVQVIPTFILLGRDGDILDRVDGGDDIPRLTKAVAALGSTSSPTDPQTTTTTTQEVEEPSLDVRLKSLIESSQVMLFMKGNPSTPKCGFSRQIVELLTEEKIDFGTFDILTDEDVRQGLKSYSDWPTYPQLYVNGELMGGLDIVKEMASEGDLAEQLGVEKTSPTQTLQERLKQLTTQHKVMLFMKGLPSAPKCGFSRQIVEILDKHNVEYDSFNILEDEEVRQGLKKYSDWPTYPQLYITGDFVGGLDIVKEMEENEEFADLFKE